MADLGQIGDLFDSILDPQYRYTIQGVVTDSLNNPAQRYVALIDPGNGLTTIPTIEMLRLSLSDGSYAFARETNTPKTVICFDVSDIHANDLVFGKVVPG